MAVPLRTISSLGRLSVGFLALVLCLMRPGRADDASERKLGDHTYRLRVAFEENFNDLENWLAETTGSIEVRDRQLHWDCSSDRKAGTIWCRKRFAGPTLVEYDAVAKGGANNLNFILYASNPPDGLLETTKQRTGAYREYHQFPNYIVTYLTRADLPPTQWRIRFRRNPGFNLLTEQYISRQLPTTQKQRLTYVMDGSGELKFFVDSRLVHEFKERDTAYREGHHGFRTWNSRVVLSNFRVYTIEK